MPQRQSNATPSVHGTRITPGETRERYCEKIARITLDSMVQFVGLLDAQGTVLEINKVALHAVGVRALWLEGDPVRLTQVLGNLLNNSAKSTDDGGLISLSARREGRHHEP